ncbi:MAG: hypothetical protein GY913_23890 [Proteobacteria bacterium]|nr:hypothetical protein [Pseudomonadota bacterium]
MLWLALSCTNMSSTRDAPFDLGRLKSALWFEAAWSAPESGFGTATILLLDEDFTCGQLHKELSGETERKDSILWTASGLLLSLDWRDSDGTNLGWEGDYYQGTYSMGSYYYYYAEGTDVAGGTVATDRRTLSASAFDEGRTWSGDAILARLAVDSGGADEVSGTTESAWWSARFDAENCGQLEAEYGYSYDYR